MTTLEVTRTHMLRCVPVTTYLSEAKPQRTKRLPRWHGSIIFTLFFLWLHSLCIEIKLKQKKKNTHQCKRLIFVVLQGM